MLVAAGLGLIGRIRITAGRPDDRSSAAGAPATRRSAGPMTANSGRRGRAAGLRDRRGECGALDRLIEAVRAGESKTLVVRGDPGAGKTMLLEHVARRASDGGCLVAEGMGVQWEMGLGFAGLHPLCTPILGRADRLPVHQRDALRTALG